MDHSLHPRLPAEELNATNLEGAAIYGADDAKIGDVSHLHGSGASAQVVVDVGGFLGIGAKPVGLDMARLDFMRDENGIVHATTALTKDEVKALPEHHD
ncbi:PRC-barrel domain-containing protein [Sulfitobacter sp. F26204]|uniref:PRC-barrel domain-containing protein n=1 Tax=Sulfitobacter sp. F26204 TaxID=2996014 RepID=UPI00225E2987|nr:PRC-barrel domain-containing protein [Sulfitobacter sp. F26204]MCX7561233.1 PRC-barrel domain-containing protein [Sulfitobacter sp. F26204]